MNTWQRHYAADRVPYGDTDWVPEEDIKTITRDVFATFGYDEDVIVFDEPQDLIDAPVEFLAEHPVTGATSGPAGTPHRFPSFDRTTRRVFQETEGSIRCHPSYWEWVEERHEVDEESLSKAKEAKLRLVKEVPHSAILYLNNDTIGVLRRPATMNVNEDRDLHALDRPALGWVQNPERFNGHGATYPHEHTWNTLKTSSDVWALQGVTMNRERIQSIADGTIRGDDVLGINNAEERRVMMESMGLEHFIQDVDADVVNEDFDENGNTRRLLRVVLDEDVLETFLRLEARYNEGERGGRNVGVGGRSVGLGRQGTMRVDDAENPTVIRHSNTLSGERRQADLDEALLQMIELRCPSTGRVYHHRVPPTVKTCKQAVAWMFNEDELEIEVGT